MNPNIRYRPHAPRKSRRNWREIYAWLKAQERGVCGSELAAHCNTSARAIDMLLLGLERNSLPVYEFELDGVIFYAALVWVEA